MEVILRPQETVQPLRKIGCRFATVAIAVDITSRFWV
jgi:hypothetical protein